MRSGHGHVSPKTCLCRSHLRSLWWSITSEEVSRHNDASLREVRQGITRYLTRSNRNRPHQDLGYQTLASGSFAPATPHSSGVLPDLPTATPEPRQCGQPSRPADCGQISVVIRSKRLRPYSPEPVSMRSSPFPHTNSGAFWSLRCLDNLSHLKH